MILDSSSITGPSDGTYLVGNPSPSSPGNLQVVESNQASFADTVWKATKAVFGTFTIGATSTAVAKASTGIAVGAEKAGSGIASAAKSASSGIKWGFILLILVGGIILLGNLRRAVG